jgi:hypothetical protein
VVEAMNPEHIVAGYLVTDALYMISNIMITVSISNATALETWDNFDRYVRMPIRQSYQAAWDALNRSYNDTAFDLAARKRVDVLKASVDCTSVFL